MVSRASRCVSDLVSVRPARTTTGEAAPVGTIEASAAGALGTEIEEIEETEEIGIEVASKGMFSCSPALSDDLPAISCSFGLISSGISLSLRDLTL